jgi:hypothetical protein
MRYGAQAVLNPPWRDALDVNEPPVEFATNVHGSERPLLRFAFDSESFLIG